MVSLLRSRSSRACRHRHGSSRRTAKFYAKPAGGPWLSPLECVYYVIGIASIVLGWYFNIHFVLAAYGQGPPTRPWGQHGSYAALHPATFTNPAASSGDQDYIIANVILLPLFTIVDGYRRGLRRPWLFFLSSLFTSFSRSRSPSTSPPSNGSAACANFKRGHAYRRLSADSVAAVITFVAVKLSSGGGSGQR